MAISDRGRLIPLLTPLAKRRDLNVVRVTWRADRWAWVTLDKLGGATPLRLPVRLAFQGDALKLTADRTVVIPFETVRQLASSLGDLMDARRAASPTRSRSAGGLTLAATAAGAISCLHRRSPAPVITGFRLGRHGGPVTSLAFVDERYAVSGDALVAQRLFRSGICLRVKGVRSFSVPGPVTALVLSPEQDRIMIAGWAVRAPGRICAGSSTTRPGGSCGRPTGSDMPSTVCLALLPGDRVLAGYYDRG